MEALLVIPAILIGVFAVGAILSRRASQNASENKRSPQHRRGRSASSVQTRLADPVSIRTNRPLPPEAPSRGEAEIPQEITRTKKSVIHEFVEGSQVKSESAFGIGAPKEVATAYPRAVIEDHLDGRVSAGWVLLSMEPHWHYERQIISGASSITRPLAIVGWYLTWQKGDQKQSVTPPMSSQSNQIGLGLEGSGRTAGDLG